MPLPSLARSSFTSHMTISTSRRNILLGIHMLEHTIFATFSRPIHDRQSVQATSFDIFLLVAPRTQMMHILSVNSAHLAIGVCTSSKMYRSTSSELELAPFFISGTPRPVVRCMSYLEGIAHHHKRKRLPTESTRAKSSGVCPKALQSELERRGSRLRVTKARYPYESCAQAPPGSLPS